MESKQEQLAKLEETLQASEVIFKSQMS